MDIAFFGLKKSGKTSIIKVIFSKMNPQQTMMLENTVNQESIKVTLGDHINFNIHDFPGDYSFADPNPPEICLIEQCGSMVFVLDVQSEPYQESYNKFLKALTFVKQHNEKCKVHFFIHKVDEDMFQSKEKKEELLQQIKENIEVEIENSNIFSEQNINITYYMTSIYDQSILESFSKVIQKVIPHVQYIRFLLDQLIAMCRMEKAFVFEVISKLCISTDQNVVDMQNFSMCSEMIDVFIDISYIYGQQEQQQNQNNQHPSSAMIKLSDGTILILREVEKFMVLITIIKEDNYDRPFLVDYNIDIFKKGLKQLFEVKM